MEIQIYKNLSPFNKVVKNLKLIDKLTGSFPYEVDITSPVIKCKSDCFLQCNYVYIPVLKRYYFVDRVRILNYGYYEANLRIDVLMSYKDLILKSKGHVSKTDSANKYVNSGYTTEVRTEYKVVPIPIKLNPNGQIIMIV